MTETTAVVEGNKLLPIEEYYTIVETTTNAIYGSLIKKKAGLNLPELRQDLYQEGMVALIECYNKFNTEKNVVFLTYALHRVRGKMLDYLRSKDTMSRTSRAKFKKIDKDFKNKDITLDEKNSKLHDINIMLTIELQAVDTADTYKGEDKTGLASIEDPHMEWNEFEQIEIKHTIDKVIKTTTNLSSNEKFVIDNYYFKEKSFKNIASELDVKQSRVSQIHISALNKLKGTAIGTHQLKA